MIAGFADALEIEYAVEDDVDGAGEGGALIFDRQAAVVGPAGSVVCRAADGRAV